MAPATVGSVGDSYDDARVRPRLTVGWRASSNATAGFVRDTLEQAIHDRRSAKNAGLVAHSDRGSQYPAIRDTERLPEAGIEPSVGSVGDSYDDALAEPVIGPIATLEWADWFDIVAAVHRPCRADRTPPAGRRGGRMRRADPYAAPSRVPQTNPPPEKPRRFTP